MSVASPDPVDTPTSADETASGSPIDAMGATLGEAPRLTVVPSTAHKDDPVASRQWPPTTARRGFGVALLGLASAGKFVAGHEQPISASAEELPALPLIDVLLGLLDLGLEMSEAAVLTTSGFLSPLLERVTTPVRGPIRGVTGKALQVPMSMTRPLAERGSRLRQTAEADAVAAVAAVLPESMEIVLDQVDLTEQAVERVDFERVMTAAFDQIDMEGMMIDKVDLGRIVHASLGQIDLTEVALKELDLEQVVLATLDRVDVFSVARDQVDPVRVATYLRENVDLAEVLRTAPGDAVRGVFDTVGRMVPGRASE